MKNRKVDFASNRVYRYIITGLFSLFFELSVLFVLTSLLVIGPLVAVSVSFWMTLVVSFTLQKLIAFQDYQKTVNVLSKQVTLYALLIAVNYSFTLFVTSLFPDDWVIVSRLVSLSIITIWNYYIYKFIFSSDIGAKKPILELFRKVSIKLVFFIALSLPILLFCYQYLTSGNKIITGDFDYYAQIYEAFRISVQEYGQFPAWNPWLSGGIPLFNNPQFGLISIQSPLVLIFGTVYGLKIAYIIYSLVGFWGMFLLGRRFFGATMLRSALVGYIWVFFSFFAAHNISHFTFTSFFLLPWLFYFIAKRDEKYSWLWLGAIVGYIALSSLHYAFLMSSLSIVIFFVMSFITTLTNNRRDLKTVVLKIIKKDVAFLVKAASVAVVVGGYRVITTYSYIASNARPAGTLTEDAPSLLVMIKAMFLPYDSIFTPPETYWGWWEYTGYSGLGVTVATIVCAVTVALYIKNKKHGPLIYKPGFVIPIILFGLLAFLFTLGDFGILSPYSLLRSIPGFSETRVSSRWVVMVIFALLMLFLAWRKTPRTINFLLLLGVIELFLTFGPPHSTGANFFSVQGSASNFPRTFQQYDNNYRHTPNPRDKYQSYYSTTSQNIGQIYGDDSIINTLNRVIGTKRCGLNINPACDLVLSDNADIVSWSPNRVILQRTAPGTISLNMNRDVGWRVNDSYIYSETGILDPNMEFLLPEGADIYTLTYSPELSPTWIFWGIAKIQR